MTNSTMHLDCLAVSSPSVVQLVILTNFCRYLSLVSCFIASI